jgi:hypothetical protein
MAVTARILEIGDFHYVKREYPDRTTLLWTGRKPPTDLDRSQYFDCMPARLLRTMADVRSGKYDLVIAYMGLRSPWHPRNWLRSLASDPLRPASALGRVFGIAWLRFVRIGTPFVVLDMNDAFIMGRHNFFLLDKADIAFKRELSTDRWHILCHSVHPALPTRRIRREQRWQRRLEKIRPIALPSPAIDTSALWQGEFPEKTVDVFFSGNVTENAWVRRVGATDLEQLAAHGVKVDFPAERLAPAEFHRRLARAWLAWSPAGFSWECFRTSEAAQCLAVPVLNFPTVELHRPLINGEHVLYYNPEPGGLVRAVEAALADRERLKRMALAARAHVLAHHTPRALVDHVIECGLRAKQSGSAVKKARA